MLCGHKTSGIETNCHEFVPLIGFIFRWCAKYFPGSMKPIAIKMTVTIKRIQSINIILWWPLLRYDAVCNALIGFTHLSLSLSLSLSLIHSLIRSVIYSFFTRSFSLSFFRLLAGVLILLSLSRQLSPPSLLRKRNSTKRNRICYLDIATFYLPRI